MNIVGEGGLLDVLEGDVDVYVDVDVDVGGDVVIKSSTTSKSSTLFVASTILSPLRSAHISEQIVE